MPIRPRPGLGEPGRVCRDVLRPIIRKVLPLEVWKPNAAGLKNSGAASECFSVRSPARRRRNNAALQQTRITIRRLNLGSALINPPAAKPFFSVWRRRKGKIDLAAFQYSFAQFFPCSLPDKKARLFAGRELMRAKPSKDVPSRQAPATVRCRCFFSRTEGARRPCKQAFPWPL